MMATVPFFCITIVLANLLLISCETEKTSRCRLNYDEGVICKSYTYDDDFDDDYDYDDDCAEDYTEERWYFDYRAQNCKKFDYRGCGGNANNFDFKEDCVEACHALPTCEQPPYTGPCRAKMERFYYDPKHGDCKKFTYGGCRANDNNFKNIEDCRKACKKDPLPTCEQPKVSGPCDGYFERYFYNSKSEKCEKFTYGGCGGNQNNFKTKSACEEECCEDEKDPCHQPKIVGPCKMAIARYYYNSNSKKCEQFTYGGCHGNKNNFKSKSDCERACDVPVATCDQPPKTGPCKASMKRYFYNGKTGKCEIFIYGGCQGNENNFETEEECKHTCAKVPVETCDLPRKTGPCEAIIKRYFYNKKTGKCEEFTYGGCQGNKNNFAKKEDCEKTCVKETCDLPRETGPCKGAINRYFYNKKTGRCEIFSYGGCGGNKNNFLKEEDCEKTCVKAYCPKKSSIVCVRRSDKCCSDADCCSGQLCCDENCGNICKYSSPVPTSGSKYPENCECEIEA